MGFRIFYNEERKENIALKSEDNERLMNYLKG